MSILKVRPPSIFVALLATVLFAAGQSGNTQGLRISITEAVSLGGAKYDSREEIFVPAGGLTNSARLHLVSTNGEAFLDLTDLRVEGTNVWFRKWEFKRNPPKPTEKSRYYMIHSGGFGQERSPEFHLEIGDEQGLSIPHKAFAVQGTNGMSAFITRVYDAAVSASPVPEKPNPWNTRRLTNVERVEQAKLIVVAEHGGISYDGRTQFKISKVEVLFGKRQPVREISIYLGRSALTTFPQQGSKWILFLDDAFGATETHEYRKIVGMGLDENGMVPYSEEALSMVKKLIGEIRK